MLREFVIVPIEESLLTPRGKENRDRDRNRNRSKQERGPMISGTRTREGEKIADAKKIRKPKGILEFGKASQRPEKGQVTD